MNNMLSDREILNELNSAINYVVDHERLNKLTDNNEIYKSENNPFIPKEGVRGNTITRSIFKGFINTFYKIIGNEYSKITDKNKKFFLKKYHILKTLKYNGVLVHLRKEKIKNILNEKE